MLSASRKTGCWQNLLAQSSASASEIASRLGIAADEIREVMIRYPARINPYALDLLGRTGEPIWRQLVPHRAELDEAGLPDADPLCETGQSPADGIIHRYPDRVLFTVSTQCPVYCRHCMRKREVGTGPQGAGTLVDAGLAYIADTPAVKEVILSGGDPLMLDDDRLSFILARIRAIDHVELVRIHTRAPGMLPARITNDLVRVLGRFHPLYVNIQFNHPDELTADAVAACSRLADAGIPLGAQTVLLAGVNDDPEVMTALMRKLLAARVRPYYLHHPDPIKGTAHFRVPLERGLSILEALRGRVSGMGVPQYMIDLPGGGGKVPLLPQYVQDHTGRHLVVYNFEKKRYTYPL